MRRNWGMFLYALLGGFCIGLGGTAFLRIKDSFTGGVVVGALFFAIGLFTISTRGGGRIGGGEDERLPAEPVRPGHPV